MKFLLRSIWGESLGVALRLLKEGNQVKFAFAKACNAGEGLVERVEFPQGVKWADVVVFDINSGRLPQEAEDLRQRSVAVIGSSEFAGRLENDRQLGMRIARDAGIPVKPLQRFDGQGAFRDAQSWIGMQDRKTEWVWKSNRSNPDDPPTFVGNSGPEIFIRMLDYYERLYRRQGRTPSFVLCPKIDGVEVSTEGWFNGRQFVLPNHTLELNRLYNGNLGPKTGCAGCVVWDGATSKLWQRLIPPLASALAGKYNGPVDVNAIIEKGTNEPVFLEFTPRFGYDALYGLCAILETDLGQLLADIAQSKLPDTRLSAQLGGTVRAHIPPYPGHDPEHEADGVPIEGWSPEDKAIVPFGMKTDDDEFVSAGSIEGLLCVATGTGTTARLALESAYRRIETLKVPQIGYRTDLAAELQKCHDSLMQTGWIERKARSFSQLLRSA